MTAPNFNALERLSALWNLLATHQDLPALKSVFYTVEGRHGQRDHVALRVATAADVDAYGKVLGLPAGCWTDPIGRGKWTYLTYDKDQRWTVILDEEVAEPILQQCDETAGNSGPERVAVQS